jgi:uncharacterized protein DUF1259/chromate resistance exported protein
MADGVVFDVPNTELGHHREYCSFDAILARYGLDQDPAKLNSALRLKGQYKEGVYKFVIGRTTRMHDVEIGNQMGVNTWDTFAGSEDKAVVDGDFAMRQSELQPLLRPFGMAWQVTRPNVILT